MSSHNDFNGNSSNRTYAAPYTPNHKVPTVQGYQARREERQAEAAISENVAARPENGGKEGLLDKTKSYLHIDSPLQDKIVDQAHPYRSQNRNLEASTDYHDQATNDRRDSIDDIDRDASDHPGEDEPKDESKANEGSLLQDTSEAIDSTIDPQKKRKNMKHKKRDHAAREVTDPVTHLKVTIHDTTNKEFRSVPENEPPPGSTSRNNTNAEPKSRSEIDMETEEQQAEHKGMEKLFPPPSLELTAGDIAGTCKLAFTIGMTSILAVSLLILVGIHLVNSSNYTSRSMLISSVSSLLLLLVGLISWGGIIWFLRGWLNIRIRAIWEDQLCVIISDQLVLDQNRRLGCKLAARFSGHNSQMNQSTC